MFEQTFVQTQAQTRKPWTVAVSLSVQCVAVGIVLLIPLLHPDNLRIPDPLSAASHSHVDYPAAAAAATCDLSYVAHVVARSGPGLCL